ncbi:DUF1827 family protein [Peribacillus muralis]|uniref:DUF1827 family protein n=1 Tax=Peribacillus muralis TaxID=264697 RepID=UPI003D045D7F
MTMNVKSKFFNTKIRMFIYTFKDKYMHVSLSNPYRKIKSKEIDYTIKKIMKVSSDICEILKTSNSEAIHINAII